MRCQDRCKMISSPCCAVSKIETHLFSQACYANPNRYTVIISNIPDSVKSRTTSPQQLILISRAIEKKLFTEADSYLAYNDLTSLKFRFTALACAILIHSEKHGDANRKRERSQTCVKLLAAARRSLSHCILVLISYESRQLSLTRY